jgi:hypothetical protein
MRQIVPMGFSKKQKRCFIGSQAMEQ